MEKKRPKVGDKVRVCRSGFRVPHGSVGHIIKDDHSSVPFLVSFDGSHLWMAESQVELIEATHQLKVGDTVRIKSRQWYEANKDSAGDVCTFSGVYFTTLMVRWLGTEHKIVSVLDSNRYRLEGCAHFIFTPEMFDLVETSSLTDKIKDFFAPDRKPTINGNIPLIKRNKLLTNIKLD